MVFHSFLGRLEKWPHFPCDRPASGASVGGGGNEDEYAEGCIGTSVVAFVRSKSYYFFKDETINA